MTAEQVAALLTLIAEMQVELLAVRQENAVLRAQLAHRETPDQPLGRLIDAT